MQKVSCAEQIAGFALSHSDVHYVLAGRTMYMLCKLGEPASEPVLIELAKDQAEILFCFGISKTGEIETSLTDAGRRNPDLVFSLGLYFANRLKTKSSDSAQWLEKLFSLPDERAE